MGRLQVIMRRRLQSAIRNLYIMEFLLFGVARGIFFYKIGQYSLMFMILNIINITFIYFFSTKRGVDQSTKPMYIKYIVTIMYHLNSVHSIMILVIPIKSLQIRNEEPILQYTNSIIYNNNNMFF
jgi:hypothetical protein